MFTVSGSLSTTACVSVIAVPQLCMINDFLKIFWHRLLKSRSYQSWHFTLDESETVHDVYFNSWPSHGCGASVLASGPWIWCCVQLCLDRKSLSHHSVDETGIWSGECIDSQSLTVFGKACVWDSLWFQQPWHPGVHEVLGRFLSCCSHLFWNVH